MGAGTAKCRTARVAPPCGGAWIEMCRVVAHPDVDVVAPRAGAWIEIFPPLLRWGWAFWSLPVRGSVD